MKKNLVKKSDQNKKLKKIGKKFGKKFEKNLKKIGKKSGKKSGKNWKFFRICKNDED
jgi:hypothetical protein